MIERSSEDLWTDRAFGTRAQRGRAFYRRDRGRAGAALVTLALAAPLGGCQMISNINAFSPAQDVELGKQTYAELLSDAKVVSSGPQAEQAQRVTARLVEAARAEAPELVELFEWEATLVDDPATVNAFCLPGGKMAVYTGILPVTQDDAGLAVVMGHEIGHFVLRHTLTIIVAATLLVTLSLWAVHRVAGRLIARFRERFGFDRLDDVASLPLLALVGGVVMLAATPAALALSRRQEREADRFGLEITRANNAAARSFVRLQEDNLAVPRTGPLFRLWRASHPDLADRIEFANRYSPWLRGQSLRYGDRFRAAEPAPAP